MSPFNAANKGARYARPIAWPCYAASRLTLCTRLSFTSFLAWKRSILAHSGGFLPFVAWRISLANALPEYAAKAPQGILEYIRRFYYDTALSPSPYSLSSLRELVDPTHILFGSDYPFAPAPIVSTCCVTLDASPVWSDDVKHGIDREHALALLPRYAGAGEAVSAVPAPSGHDLRSMGRRLRGQLARGVLERIRNR